MKLLRAIFAVVLLAALVVGATNVSSTSGRFPLSSPCTGSALSAAYHDVRSVQSFGCVGRWAYLWATVGSGVHEISVTDVLHFDDSTSRWRDASRLVYCDHHRLPAYVQHWGCNSN